VPIPLAYQNAAQDFEAFLRDAMERAAFSSFHPTYTMAQGVLQAFRRRLTVAEAARFANALPPLLRALFFADWDPAEPRRPFGSVAEMTREVKGLRPDHNLSPDDAIANVASALRKVADPLELERALASLPPEARAFWGVEAG
jgi:uncharacterized protein (DUF2267 family)